MALPKKGSRTITVGDCNYRWIASGNDGWIDLYIESKDTKGQLLKAKFDYHHKETKMTNGIGLKQQLVVTPDIVRQTIELGINQGWNPTNNGKSLDLHHIDDKIDWQKNEKDIKSCDECASEYYANTSNMSSLCPDCSHHLYGYPNCEHNFANGRCTKCYWHGESTDYIRGLKKE